MKSSVIEGGNFPTSMRKLFTSCAQFSDRVLCIHRLFFSVYHCFFSKGKLQERETNHLPPSCPRLIRKLVTYRHFPCIKYGSWKNLGQIHILSFTYEFYSTLLGPLGHRFGHLQPSFFSVIITERIRQIYNPSPNSFAQTLCESDRKDMYFEIWALLGFYVT